MMPRTRYAVTDDGVNVAYPGPHLDQLRLIATSGVSQS